LADQALLRLDVDDRGLDAMDRRYLKAIIEHYAGGPVGLETLSAFLSEQKDVLEEVIEPYLIQQGFLQRTSRGRMVNAATFSYFGIQTPPGYQADLLG
jgi:Holliday junction DNA helicase RuvB